MPELRDILNRDIESYLKEWLPDGKVMGNEYVALNPTRDDNSPGSFKINIKNKAGVWADPAVGQAGGDLITLYAYLNDLPCTPGNKAEYAKVAALLEKKYNLNSASKKPAKKISGKIIDEKLELVFPVPENAPQPPMKLKIDDGGPKEFDRRYEYKNEQGKLLHYIYRFETEPKTIIPYTLWRGGDGKLFWDKKAFKNNRPLYGLDWLAKYPEKPVLVVEGEKCVEALRWHFLDNEKNKKRGEIPYVPVTWSGGSNATEKVDFIPLLNKEIIYWPDNDDTGIKAMQKIKTKCPGIMLDIAPLEKEKGWDIADLILENQENENFDFSEYIYSLIAHVKSAKNDLILNSNIAMRQGSFLHYNKRGEPRDTIENLKVLLRAYGMKIKYNVISKKMEYEMAGEKYQTVDSANDFFAEVKSICSLNGMPRAEIRIYLSKIGSENLINPVLDWINSKPYKSSKGDFSHNFQSYKTENLGVLEENPESGLPEYLQSNQTFVQVKTSKKDLDSFFIRNLLLKVSINKTIFVPSKKPHF